MFKAGYKFKETHEEIHYVKADHKTKGMPYNDNFTTDQKSAKGFDKEQEAETCILDLMSAFEKDDDYRWTPVIINAETQAKRMLVNYSEYPEPEESDYLKSEDYGQGQTVFDGYPYEGWPEEDQEQAIENAQFLTKRLLKNSAGNQHYRHHFAQPHEKVCVA